jgi:hypothetical protein
VYKNKFRPLLLFVSVFFAAAVSLQSDGDGWRALRTDFRAEAHQDSIALREDARLLKDGSKSTPSTLKMVWTNINYSMTELQADVRAESKVAATRLTTRRQDH